MKSNRKFNVYIDGGSRGNPGHGACAVAIFDEKGKLLQEEGKYLGKCTNNFAEYSGFHLALFSARHLGAVTLKVFSDSELLVKQFSGEYKIKDAVLSNLMKEIKKEVSRFKEIILKHIPRKENAYADKLVNKILNNTKLTQDLGKSVFKENTKKLHQPDLF